MIKIRWIFKSNEFGVYIDDEDEDDEVKRLFVIWSLH